MSAATPPPDPAAIMAAVAGPMLSQASALMPADASTALSFGALASSLDAQRSVFSTSPEAIATINEATSLLRSAQADPANDETKQAMLDISVRLAARGANSDATVPAALDPDDQAIVDKAEAAYADDVSTDETNDVIANAKEAVLSTLEDNPLTQWFAAQAATIKLVATVVAVGGLALVGFAVWRSLRRAA